MDSHYLRALKSALLGEETAPLVLICNFEVETRWARSHVGLPNPGLSVTTEVVRRMSELGALLAGPDDTLLLPAPLDPAYRDYLAEIGMPPPRVLVADDPRELAGRLGGHLLPMGTSDLEEELARDCGIPLAVPDAATYERVNGKVYGRRLVADAGVPAIPGSCCETVDDLVAALARHPLPVVVKDSYGVSGKGLVVLDSAVKRDRLVRMVLRRAERSGDRRLDVVVEQWLPKAYDLNYQLTIARTGTVQLDFVKRALTANGVHKGHLMPAGLDAGQHALVADTAAALGERLYKDGFHGVVGVDAILTTDGRLYPALELNARLNMSTYQGTVTERFVPPGQQALAKHYELAHPLRFDQVRRALAPFIAVRQLVITCFGTATVHPGRLYVLLTGPDLTALDAAVHAALEEL
jgi:carbamoyl-phosphate synthase L subunit-like protein/pre ATP-grasp domain-containing protein